MDGSTADSAGDFRLLDMLERPVWAFSPGGRPAFWANEAARALWSEAGPELPSVAAAADAAGRMDALARSVAARGSGERPDWIFGTPARGMTRVPTRMVSTAGRVLVEALGGPLPLSRGGAAVFAADGGLLRADGAAAERLATLGIASARALAGRLDGAGPLPRFPGSPAIHARLGGAGGGCTVAAVIDAATLAPALCLEVTSATGPAADAAAGSECAWAVGGAADAIDTAGAFERFASATPAQLAMLDADGRFAMANRQFLAFHGRRADEVIGRLPEEVWSAEAAGVFAQTALPGAGQGAAFQLLTDRAIARGGALAVTVFDLTDRAGRPAGRGIVMIDRNAEVEAENRRRAAEALLETTRSRFRTLFELAPVGIALNRFDDGRFVEVNPAMAAMNGVPVEALVGTTYWDRLPPVHHGRERAALEEMRRHGSHAPFERQHLRADGTPIDVVLTGRLMTDENGEELILSTIQDITAQKKTERRLRLLSERLSLAVDAAGLGVIEYDIATRRMICNARMAEIYGIPDMLHSRPAEWFSRLHRADRRAVMTEMGAVLQRPTPTRFGFRVVRPDGEIRHVQAAARLIAENGRPSRIVAITIDVTADVRMSEALEARTRDAEAGDRAKSRFLANMSHEIRTPLNGVLGVAQLLERTELDARQREYTHLIRASGMALLDLIEDLLDISRIEAGVVELDHDPFDCDALIDSALATVRGVSEAKGLTIALTRHGLPCGTLAGDVKRVRQVLINLLGNAVKFTERGRVTLSVTRTAERLHFAVRDTGPGVPEEARGRLFERFSKLRACGGTASAGTGLGLSISRDLVTLMGGRIGYAAPPEGGSVFWFELPLGLPRGSARETAAEEGVAAAPRNRDATAC